MGTTTSEEERTYYEILGVGRKASETEIQKAYKRLAFKFHPDKQNQNDADAVAAATAAFQAINNAHECLTDENQRRAYDQKLDAAAWRRTTQNSQRASDPFSEPRQQQAPPPPPPPSNASTGSRGGNPHARSSSSYRDYYGFGNKYNGSSGRTWSSHRRYSSTRGERKEPKRPPPPPPPQSHSHRYYDSQQQKSSYHHGAYSGASHRSHCDTGPQQEKDRKSSKPPHTFGRRKSDGEPCKRCMKQGCFCYQHTHQDPNYCHNSGSKARSSGPQPHYSSSSSSSHNHHGNSSKVYGVRKDGLPCQRCQKQCGFCYQHVDQQQYKKYQSSGKTTTFGVRADGNPCLRCQRQGKFCYQHQQQRAYY